MSKEKPNLFSGEMKLGMAGEDGRYFVCLPMVLQEFIAKSFRDEAMAVFQNPVDMSLYWGGKITDEACRAILGDIWTPKLSINSIVGDDMAPPYKATVGKLFYGEYKQHIMVYYHCIEDMQVFTDDPLFEVLKVFRGEYAAVRKFEVRCRWKKKSDDPLITPETQVNIDLRIGGWKYKDITMEAPHE